ncbi:hypothetical protein Tco_0299670 [Tanacetum coccineum]
MNVALTQNSAFVRTGPTEKYALPYDLADSDVEDLINVDEIGVEKVYSLLIVVTRCRMVPTDDVAVMIVPITRSTLPVAGCFANKGKNFWIIGKGKKRKPIWAEGRRQAEYPHKTPDLSQRRSRSGRSLECAVVLPFWEKFPKERKAATFQR